MISSSHFIESNHLLTGNQLPPRLGVGGKGNGTGWTEVGAGGGDEGEGGNPEELKCILVLF